MTLPDSATASPFEWGRAARAVVQDGLEAAHAVLVRGVPGLEAPAHYKAFIDGVGYARADYVPMFINRKMEDGLFDATANPDNFLLAPHNENVFYKQQPGIIDFAMLQPATRGGGETLIVLNHEITQMLARKDLQKGTGDDGAPLYESVLDHFAERDGILYTWLYPSAEKRAEYAQQTPTAKIMPTWQSWRKTDDPSEAAKFYEDRGMQARFDPNDGLYVTHKVPAAPVGPDGQSRWFNFAASPGIPPFFTIRYGNGDALEPEIVQAVRNASMACAVALPLQRGDVIFFDNLACMHGRTPFRGKRKLLVEMAMP